MGRERGDWGVMQGRGGGRDGGCNIADDEK